MGCFPSAPQLRRERHPVIIARINKDERRAALTPGNLQLQHLTFGSDPQFGPSGHVARNAGQPGHCSPTRVYSNYGMAQLLPPDKSIKVRIRFRGEVDR